MIISLLLCPFHLFCFSLPCCLALYTDRKPCRTRTH